MCYRVKKSMWRKKDEWEYFLGPQEDVSDEVGFE